MSIITTVKSHLFNIPGLRTRRKILVFESDDWGSIRTPSLSALESLKQTGLPVQNCQYMMNDALETPRDLDRLFEILQKYQDCKGRPPKFTANTIVANPDFEKIREGGFEEYHYEPFTETYKKHAATTATFQTFQTGIENGLFLPQLHGREHLNISRWMRDLKAGVKEVHLAFGLQMTGISKHITQSDRGSYQAAFDGGAKEVNYRHDVIMKDAVSLFESSFGFRPLSFIAPNYVWHKGIEDIAFELGIKYIQGSTAQNVSKDHGAPRKISRHFMGQRNRNQQRYLVRNAHFEPTLSKQADPVDKCLQQINRAFLWRKPAIITTHRVNYIGSINDENSDNSLRQLDQLLLGILRRWPDVEFMSSDELGKLMDKNG
ncbi:hypothetical protein [Phaeodactylibacter sp.]|uniref:hypothetical protein n=1 Tax=Phaeodactylibacter sp. TaxID=1940289 RepID=UPI0025F4AD4C|nr:hypothetical protein [Phaeodactylibacter sp.]MCI4647568.1 hypothetical protein [Phaeodactylibacter sp.]MCI5090803.1 hypothetical protein [Phaeodactylibacter sp.]